MAEQGPQGERGQGEGAPPHGHGADMGSRGVTRPMALQGHDSTEAKRHDRDDGAHRGHEQHHDMSREQRFEKLREHHEKTLWIPWTLVLLGAWTALSPFMFGYGTALTSPSGGRDVWLDLQARVTLMTWSDVVSGALLLVFGWRALKPGRPVSLWLCCLVGVWLSLAPVVFWAPSAAAYLNGTLVGMLVIALTILIPGMPNMIMFMKMGPPVPEGWSYNPSSWPQRFVMIALGFAGFFASRYLAAFQLGYIGSVWDPFFGDGTRRVLNSDMSHMWPISDAALGTFAYTLEFLMGFMGSPARWRTMPWMVAFYGVLVIPLGLVHIFLVISQPIVVGEWCTFCLLAALIMLPMLPLEGDEVVAMGQHVLSAKRRGERVWTVFWKGGQPGESAPDERTPKLARLPDQPGAVLSAGLWGMSVPWTLVASIALALWLIFSPVVFGVDKPAADAFRLVGLLTVTSSVIAMGEVFRLARYANVLLGLGLAIAPWLMNGSGVLANVHAVVVGLALVALALPRGPKRERYGTWDRFVR